MMEAADRLREIGHRLTAGGQPEAADDKYRMVGVYMLRSEPDYVISDVELGQPGKIRSDRIRSTPNGRPNKGPNEHGPSAKPTARVSTPTERQGN